MKRRTLVLRIGAVASSVLLVGGYVGYRAWAGRPGDSVETGQPPSEQDHFSGSKSAAVFEPPPPPKPNQESQEFMLGSKSGRVVKPEEMSPAMNTPAPKSTPTPEPNPKPGGR